MSISGPLIKVPMKLTEKSDPVPAHELVPRERKRGICDEVSKRQMWERAWPGPSFGSVLCPDPAFTIYMEFMCAWILLWCKATASRCCISYVFSESLGLVPLLSQGLSSSYQHAHRPAQPTNSPALLPALCLFEKPLLGLIWQYLTT